ncbi:MAG TPA: carboxypeptidase-like regulatory domain-containing protein, partial [Vicinamibacterales bacterium]|nr:carboxypeptidase-like regulatory domain-containing protein [Vicinamibacterales bacterium]
MSKAAVARLAWVGVLVLSTFAPPAWGQITTSTITGTIKDQQGGVMPGATVTLISETKGTQSTPVVTNDVGSFVIPNVTADTYTVQVEMPSFKTLKRAGLQVSAGSQVAVPPLTLEVGGAAEVVTVTSEAPIIQASSGERSFAVSSEQVSNLPASTRAFIQYTVLAPGVENNGLQRIGGGGQSNVMMDGVSTMDTGNNGLMLQLTNESIAEVKLVASGYNAEFGRSSGLQISVVTKSGTNQFHGGLYDIERDSKWNNNSKTNILNGDPKTASKQRDWGYSIGGPIGRPGGNNKLFFFYTQEYSPRTAGNDVVRFRVPTLQERAGDFSQSTDQNGALYNLIKDPQSPNVCTAANTSGCFADGGVLGRIPANRLYQTGLNILKMWPEPNVAPGLPYNFQLTRPKESALSWQPVARVDYQPMAKLRATFKATGWAQTNQVFNGSIPGFNDTVQAHPVVSLYAVTANYTFSPTLIAEATVGRSQNERAGCSPGGNQVGAVFCTGGVPVNPISNIKNAGLSDLPFLFPTSSLIDKRYYAYTALTEMIHSPVFENDRVMRPPTFAWGSRVATANVPPSIPFPNFLNINTTVDMSISLTKVAGNHTMKTGFYRYHSYKAENQRNNAFGTLSFANDTANPFDTSFGFANAAIGSFSSYSQSSRYIEGQWDYYNSEAYAQDSWRVNSRMTVDAGLRFVHQEPLRDRLGQEANFFQDKWSLAAAPRLYVAGCANGVSPCTGTNRQAMDPVTGQFLGPLSGSAISAVVPNTGNPLNGLLTQASGSLGRDGYTYPAIGVEPRLGFAYDLGGQQKFVIRGSGGLFFDRPSTSSYNQVNNPPIAQNVTVQFGQLQNLGSTSGVTVVGAPALQVIKFDSGLPSSAQWSGGVQTRLPWSLALDTAYVGQHAWNQASSIDLNTIDIGSAFLPQNQDPTRSASTTPGGTAVSNDLMRAMRGYAAISVRADTSERTYHSVQVSLQRRMRSGVSFGFADTISVSDRQNIVPRYQHDANGNVTIRSDQQEAEKLLGSSLTPLHTMRANAIWQLPTLTGSAGARKLVGAIVNDWQVSGIWSGVTGTPYSLGFSYPGITSLNLTGSPDFPARVRVVGNASGGCSSDIYRQFDVTAFQGPLSGSTGLESSNDYLSGCFQSSIDMSLSRTIRFGGTKTVQLRMDV